MGCLRAGICVAPLSTLASSEALIRMINDSQAKLLFISPDCWDMIGLSISRLSILCDKDIIFLDKCKSENSCLRNSLAKRETLLDLIDNATDKAVNITINPDWGFNLIYSS